MDLIPSFKKSLFSNTVDPIMDLGEIFLDTVFEDGILKEIPVIKSIIALVKTGTALRERQMAKNTYAFIKGLRERTISQEKIDAHRKRLEDPKCASRELGFVLLMLEREIHAEKARISGRSYAAVVDGEITWDQYQELVEALDRMFMKDFTILERIGHGMLLPIGTREDEMYGLQRLQGLGFAAEQNKVEQRGKTWGDLENGDPVVITSFGRLLLRFTKG